MNYLDSVPLPVVIGVMALAFFAEPIFVVILLLWAAFNPRRP